MMDSIQSVMLAIAIKATVAAGVGLGAAWLARGSRAAVRHAWLAGTFAALLLLPAASVVAPPVRIWAPAVTAVPAINFSVAAVSSAAAPAKSTGISLSAVLLAVWAGGMALFLLPVAMGLWQVSGLRRRAARWAHGQEVADELAAETGMRRGVEVMLHAALPGPMTCGAVNAAIVLPVDAQTWDAGNLNRALVHEMEHVRRGDWAVQCAGRVICAAYWFHPLVWMAWSRLKLEAERSCDDAVLLRSDATEYADQLVGLARRLSAAAAPALAMANHADLKARVSAMLDGKQQRGRAGKQAVAAACAGAVLLVMAISPLQVGAAPQTDAVALSGVQIHATTGLVVEAVFVADSGGKTYEGLSASDFAITEDGVPQNISLFEFRPAGGPENPVKSYYALGYYTKNPKVDGAFRKVAITCKVTSAKLDYRSGYYGNKAWGPNGAPVAGSSSSYASQGGEGVTPPRLVRKVEPAYSEEARKAKFQGHVTLAVTVDATGKVTNARVVKSLGLGLDEKAVEAAQQWRFTPGMKDGKPVAVQVEVGMDFRLL